MKENIDKREGQLLAKLNRERNRAPTDVVREWLADGETIRALGAPMGNSFNIKEWWETRYRTVKTRVALWPSLRRLSLTGRNTLLQSIFYGSFRYWLGFAGRSRVPKVAKQVAASRNHPPAVPAVPQLAFISLLTRRMRK